MNASGGSDMSDGPFADVFDAPAAVLVRKHGQSKDDVTEPHDAPSALNTLGQLVAMCDDRTQAPQWWKKVSPRMSASIDLLKVELTGRTAPRASARAPDSDDEDHPLVSTLADLKAQQAKVIDALAHLTPSARSTRDSIVPLAPGPRFRSPPFCITVSLASVPAKDTLHRLTAADVKAAIDAALRQSKIPSLFGSTIHSVRRDRCKLFVHTSSLDHKAALVQYPDEWLRALSAGAKLAVRKIALQVNLVSTRFSPNNVATLDALYLSNPTIIAAREFLHAVRWMHESRAGKAERSSLVLTVTDLDTAQKIVHEGLCVLGEFCPTDVLVPAVRQCYRCLGFGHESSQCLKQHPPHPLACGRCVSPDHATGGCTCPARPACVAMRTCTHVRLKSVNCGGEHKAFDALCPVKAGAIEQATQSSSYRALFLELTQ